MSPRATVCVRSLAVALTLPFIVAACGDDDGGGGGGAATVPSGEAITEAGFHFGDASLPPEAHRSWTVTVTPDMAYVVVDSYGDVVGEDTAEITPAVWEDLQAAVAALADDEPDLDGDGCEGGTGAAVWAREGESDLFDMSAEACVGNNSDVIDRWEAPFEPVLALFDMEALTAPE